jgi:hypothetical protein
LNNDRASLVNFPKILKWVLGVMVVVSGIIGYLSLLN